MWRRLAIMGILFLLPQVSGATPPETMSFDEIQVGMKGSGRTVFAGDQVVSFDVEIVGKLPNIAPGQNLILARLAGGPLATTRILSGMSGSPVMIDGKLIGAVAYSWGFATEPIAGITPIAQMLSRATSPPRRTGSATTGPSLTDLSRLDSVTEVVSIMRQRIRRLFALPPGSGNTSRPLAIRGLPPRAVATMGRLLEGSGWHAVQAGGSRDTGGATTLEPGSAVGVKLVRGDVEMAATGTVTWVDGDQVHAFGHPLLGLGVVDLPMTAATVQLAFPSLRQSVRFASTGRELGALRLDHASGIIGQLGQQADMIPVRMTLSGPGRESKTHSFDLMRDAGTTPILLFLSLNGVLASYDRVAGPATLRLREGSVIRRVSGEDVRLDNLFVGEDAVEQGFGMTAYLLYLLMNQTGGGAEIDGINLLLSYEAAPRLLQVQRARTPRQRIPAGEGTDVTVTLQTPWGSRRDVTLRLDIPRSTAPGPLRVLIGDARAIQRIVGAPPVTLPASTEALVRLINRLRHNNDLILAADRNSVGVRLGSVVLPSLPPSAARQANFSRSGSSGRVQTVRIAESTETLDFAIQGYAELAIEVVEP